MRIMKIGFLLAAALSSACGDGGDDGGGPNNTPNTLTKAGGDNQNAVVNTALPNDFCAKVTTGAAAAPNVTVTWSTPSGGSLNPPTSLTSADGLACSRLTLGTAAGPQTAAAAVSEAIGSPVTFNATANPGNATTLVKAGGDNQSGNVNTVLGEPLGVQVTDAFGNGVPGALVTWLLNSGTASLNPLSGNTNASGLATTVATLGGTPGPIVITASAAGLLGSPQTFNLTADALPPPVGAITITVSNNAFTPQVGTITAGGTVTWNWANTAGVAHSVTSTGPTSFTSDPAGEVPSPHSYGPITFSTPGTYFYYCTAHGNPGNPPTLMSGTIIVQ